MRTVLYKNGFLRYFCSLIEYCQQTKKRSGAAYFFVAFAILASASTQETFTYMSGILLACIAIYLGGLRNNRPNVVTLSPVSWQKKAAYSFLSPILFFVLAVAAMVTVKVMFLLIGTAYGLLVGFEIGGMWRYAFTFDPYSKMGLYGIIFGLIFELACYSAGMFSTYIKKGGYKALFVFLFCLAVYLCLQFMSLPLSLTLEKGIRFTGFFIGSPFFPLGYEYMKYPWLAVTLCGVAVLAFFGVTIWFVLMRSRGKDY